MEDITFFPLGQNAQICKNSVQEENSKNELLGISRIEELIKATKRAESKTTNHQSVENVKENQEESVNPKEWEKKKNQQYETADSSSNIFLNFSELNKSHPHETDLIGEIEINIMDMLNSSSIIVSGVKKDNKIINETLKKLNYLHLEEILRKIQENKTELKNPKRWLQSLIFNQALEKEVSMQSKVNAMLHK